MEHLQNYRAYHLKPDGGIQRAEVITAKSDSAALHKLRHVPNDHGIELWDRARFVGRVAPHRTPAEAAG